MKRKRQALNGEEMKWSRREKRRKGVATKGSAWLWHGHEARSSAEAWRRVATRRKVKMCDGTE